MDAWSVPTPGASDKANAAVNEVRQSEADTSSVARSLCRRQRSGGTEGSNPVPSSGESANSGSQRDQRYLGKGAP